MIVKGLEDSRPSSADAKTFLPSKMTLRHVPHVVTGRTLIVSFKKTNQGWAAGGTSVSKKAVDYCGTLESKAGRRVTEPGSSAGRPDI